MFGSAIHASRRRYVNEVYSIGMYGTLLSGDTNVGNMGRLYTLCEPPLPRFYTRPRVTHGVPSLTGASLHEKTLKKLDPNLIHINRTKTSIYRR